MQLAFAVMPKLVPVRLGGDGVCCPSGHESKPTSGIFLRTRSHPTVVYFKGCLGVHWATGVLTHIHTYFCCFQSNSWLHGSVTDWSPKTLQQVFKTCSHRIVFYVLLAPKRPTALCLIQNKGFLLAKQGSKQVQGWRMDFDPQHWKLKGWLVNNFP